MSRQPLVDQISQEMIDLINATRCMQDYHQRACKELEQQFRQANQLVVEEYRVVAILDTRIYGFENLATLHVRGFHYPNNLTDAQMIEMIKRSDQFISQGEILSKEDEYAISCYEHVVYATMVRDHLLNGAKINFNSSEVVALRDRQHTRWCFYDDEDFDSEVDNNNLIARYSSLSGRMTGYTRLAQQYFFILDKKVNEVFKQINPVVMTEWQKLGACFASLDERYKQIEGPGTNVYELEQKESDAYNALQAAVSNDERKQAQERFNLASQESERLVDIGRSCEYLVDMTDCTPFLLSATSARHAAEAAATMPVVFNNSFDKCPEIKNIVSILFGQATPDSINVRFYASIAINNGNVSLKLGIVSTDRDYASRNAEATLNSFAPWVKALSVFINNENNIAINADFITKGHVIEITLQTFQRVCEYLCVQGNMLFNAAVVQEELESMRVVRAPVKAPVASSASRPSSASSSVSSASALFKLAATGDIINLKQQITPGFTTWEGSSDTDNLYIKLGTGDEGKNRRVTMGSVREERCLFGRNIFWLQLPLTELRKNLDQKTDCFLRDCLSKKAQPTMTDLVPLPSAVTFH